MGDEGNLAYDIIITNKSHQTSDTPSLMAFIMPNLRSFRLGEVPFSLVLYSQ